MRRGFTILELLVASLLLGMLMTVLTMVFNQSSISWRTGVAGLVDMDEVRDNIAGVRDEADNLYIWNGEVNYIQSIWKDDASTPTLRGRAIDKSSNSKVNDVLKSKIAGGSENPEISDMYGPIDVKSTDAQGGKNWIVNVKSSGPNKIFDDYDDIWSNPDDFD